MADGLPPIQFNLSDAGAPVVIVEQVEVSDRIEALRRAPALSDPKFARAYAQVVNHLAKGYKYEVIMDPAAFKADFMAKYNAEDPNAVVAPGVMRLRNFALPDFDSITPPQMTEGTLEFFARSAYRGTAFHVVVPPEGPASYRPVKSAP
jgi:hypothetical protein